MVLRGSKKLKRGDLRWRLKTMRSSFDIVHVDVWLSVVCVSSSQCHVFARVSQCGLFLSYLLYFVKSIDIPVYIFLTASIG